MGQFTISHVLTVLTTPSANPLVDCIVVYGAEVHDHALLLVNDGPLSNSTCNLWSTLCVANIALNFSLTVASALNACEWESDHLCCFFVYFL